MKETRKTEEANGMQYYAAMLRRHWRLLSLGLIAGSAAGAVIAFGSRPLYRATVQLIIEKERDAPGSPYDKGVDIDTSEIDYYQTQYRLIKNRTIAREVVEALRLRESDEFGGTGKSVTDEFLDRVIVDPVRESRLVNVSAESYSPALAARMANTLADAYVKKNLENRLFASKEVLNRLPRGVSPENISESEIIESFSPVVNNPLIQSLKGELVKYEAEHAHLSRRYKSRHPAMVTALARIDYLKGQIKREMDNAVASIRIDLSGGFKANNARVVEYAEIPREPERPRKARLIALLSLLGLAAGMGLAYYAENADTTIKSESDVERHLRLPVLGIVPVAGSKGIVNAAAGDAAGAEAIKMIRTSITFSAPEEHLKTLLVTSCLPRAGKSFVALNIAASFAETGKSVLLVDADLRLAALSLQMKAESGQGLSDCIVGRTSPLSCIRATDVPGLGFLPAGGRTPNPAELLGTPGMADAIARLRAAYDRVIFDSAPVLPVSDTLNIAGKMDGAVYVVYSGKVSRDLVDLGKRQLLGVGARITGVVLNYVNIKARSYEYPYYAHNDYYAKA